MDMPNVQSGSAFEDELMMLRRRFCGRAMAELEVVEEQLECESQLAPEARERLWQLAHRLVGSCGTFGVERADRPAHALLAATRRAATVGELIEAVRVLRAELHAEAGMTVPATSPGGILLIEDDEDIVLLVEMVLRTRGLSVEVRRDGQSGWERLCAEPRPALTLLDLTLPGIDGEGVLRRCAERFELRGMPILVMSARLDLPRVARTAGDAVEFLQKPFHVGELQRRVAAMLGGPR